MLLARGVGLGVAVLLAATCLGWPLQAVEAASPWSKPKLLFSTTGYAGYPLPSADSSGDVHLIFMTLNQHKRDVSTTTQGTLMYARLHKGVWSIPTDVLVTPGGGPINLPATSLDAQGYLHVVWQGGFSGYIYYSRAHVSEADAARGWTKPQVLSNGGASGSSIFAASDGRLHFLYASLEGVIYYRQSSDGGSTWSPQATIVDTRGSSSQADFPRVIADDTGRVYATWNQYQVPDAWPALGAFSMRSVDAGDSWQPAMRVAAQDYGFITVQPTSGNTVYRVWNSIADLRERRYQLSADAGVTWSPSQFIPSLEGGFSGPPSLVLDSVGTLHLVTSTLPRQLTTPGGVYEVALNGTSWSDPMYVSQGVEGVSVEQPSITIANGDRLFAAWEQDFSHIWTSERRLSTPQDPPRPVPAPQMTPTASDTLVGLPGTDVPGSSRPAIAAPTVASQEPPPTATPVPGPKVILPPAPPSRPYFDPVQALLATVVPSLLLVAGVVIFRLMRRGA